MELPLVYLISALAVGLIGPGTCALDSILRIRFPEPISLFIGITLVVIGAALALATRAPHSHATTTIRPEGSSLSRP
jgi:hypothetical protein